jgi:hypothetical protein
MLTGRSSHLTINGLSTIIFKAIEFCSWLWAKLYAQMVVFHCSAGGNLCPLPSEREKGGTIPIPQAIKRSVYHNCLDFAQRLRPCLSLLAVYPDIQIDGMLLLCFNSPIEETEKHARMRKYSSLIFF